MGLIAAIAIFFCGLLVSVLSPLLADDVKELVPWLTNRLITNALRNLPLDFRHRYGEEWRSHLNEIPGQIGKFLFAINLVVCSKRISISTSIPQIALEDARRSDTDTFQFPVKHCALFTIGAGALAGQTFLVVDVNGLACYEQEFIRIP